VVLKNEVQTLYKEAVLVRKKAEEFKQNQGIRFVKSLEKHVSDKKPSSKRYIEKKKQVTNPFTKGVVASVDDIKFVKANDKTYRAVQQRKKQQYAHIVFVQANKRTINQMVKEKKHHRIAL